MSMHTAAPPRPRTAAHVLADSVTMLRRSLVHGMRNPMVTLLVASVPIVMLLLFVYVFGNTLGAGLGVTTGARPGDLGDYLAFVVPGILLLGVASAGQGTAISVAMDMTSGIIARFRTMAISRSAVVSGHVLGSGIQTVAGIAIVVGVALLMGFRPSASPLEWLAAIGLLLLIIYALTWLSVALGMFGKTVESASNWPMPLILLPMLGSGFVPTASMPGWLQGFAEWQPFTPMTNALRGLLLGGLDPLDVWLSVGWCVAIAGVGWLWARSLYERRSVRA